MNDIVIFFGVIIIVYLLDNSLLLDFIHTPFWHNLHKMEIRELESRQTERFTETYCYIVLTWSLKFYLLSSMAVVAD